MDLASLAVDALRLALWLSLPAIAASALVGLVMGLVGAVAQTQEPSVSFVPRLFAVAGALLLARGMLAHELTGFAARLVASMAQLGR